jgi:hypothetical protein
VAVAHMIENTQRKLREARFFLDYLVSESKRAVRNEPEAFTFFLSAFLGAARSVSFVLQKEEKQKYDAWFPSWKAALTSDETRLFKFMANQRTAEVKLTGAEKTSDLEQVLIRELPQENRSHPAYGYGVHDLSAPWTDPATVGIVVHYFTIDDSPQKVVDICALYLQLLERLVQDFINSHAPA